MTGGAEARPGRTAKVIVWVLTAAVVALAAVAVVSAVRGVDGGLELVGPAPSDPTDGGDPAEGGVSTDGSVDGGGSTDGTVESETVDELIAFVERERALEFLERPTIVFAAEDDFLDALFAEIERDLDLDDMAAAEHTYRALGWIEPADDLLDVLGNLFGSGVVGFYTPRNQTLYVRGADLTPYTKLVLVHELVHALEDQHFGLDRPEYDDRLDEVAFGFAAIVEGSATRIENAYRASLSRDEQDAIAREELALASGIDFGSLPLELVLVQISPYTDGETLVEAVIASGGLDALAAAFADPPTTSRMVLEPEVYLRGEGAQEVAPPPAGGEVLAEGLFGQLALQVMLQRSSGPSVSRQASTGWAGDWYVVWEADGESCLRADVRMDDGREADELAEVLRTWADRRPAATVGALDEATVRFTSCVPIG